MFDIIYFDKFICQPSTVVSLELNIFIKSPYGHQGGKAGVGVGGGGMNWEIGIDMYTLVCIK